MHLLTDRLGATRLRLPAGRWDERRFNQLLKDEQLAAHDLYAAYRTTGAPAFFFRGADRHKYRDTFNQWDQSAARTPTETAEKLLRGCLLHYEHLEVERGFPPDWHSNPFTHERLPHDQHWTRIRDYSQGDIKGFWEASRFGFTYALVRAYWRTGDERYAEAFWQLVENWREANQPQLGVNWKCGQEVSIRLLAWCFGLHGMSDSAATTATRVARLSEMIAVSADRIDRRIEFALNQKSNHGVSEAVGLWTAGLLFPEFVRSEHWRQRGREVLESLARSLIYDDGSFSQHSVNYHRVMLDGYLWAIRLGELNDYYFSEGLKERFSRATRWLYAIQDGSAGEVPAYGQLDGARILPLSNADYRDYRPTLQGAHFLDSGERIYADGAHDEALLWLFGPRALTVPNTPSTPGDWAAPDGGYYLLRDVESSVFVRGVTRFAHRPSQADLLHLDLRLKGDPITCDPGTFLYNGEEPWNNAFARTRYHNTIEVGGCDQMDLIHKFMWVPWPRGEPPIQGPVAGAERYWEGTHDGYKRLTPSATHRRAVLGLGGDLWAVIDRLESPFPPEARLHWLFPDQPYQWCARDLSLSLRASEREYFVAVSAGQNKAEGSLVRADPHSPRGWVAPYYFKREPALSLAVHAQTDLFVTIFSPTPCGVSVNDTEIYLHSAGRRMRIRLNAAGVAPFVSSVEHSPD